MDRHSRQTFPTNHNHNTKLSNNGVLNATSHLSNNSSNGDGDRGNKKWSLKRFFRRKRETMSDSSSEEDRKAGFAPMPKHLRNSGSSKFSKARSKGNRGSKTIATGFDHVIVNKPATVVPPQQAKSSSQDHQFFLPVETVTQQETNSQQHCNLKTQSQDQVYNRSCNSLDKHIAISMPKSLSTQRLPFNNGNVHSSSAEDIMSLNSTTFAKYLSDESIQSGGQAMQNNSQSRRSRASRNKRYYKRRSCEGESNQSHAPLISDPHSGSRWKTQPMNTTLFNGPSPPHMRNRSPFIQPMIQQQQQQQQQNGHFRNSNSLQHMNSTHSTPRPLQEPVSGNKRSISYDNHIHLRNTGDQIQGKPLPPPPPPRNPLRRVNIKAHLQNTGVSDLRPLSCTINETRLPLLTSNSVGNNSVRSAISGRCVSDDKIWIAPTPRYQSISSQNMPQHHQSQSQPHPHHINNRVLLRNERDGHTGKMSLPNGLDFHYMTDSMPRSRKPIHLRNQQQNLYNSSQPQFSGIVRTTKNGLPSPVLKPTASEYWKRYDQNDQHLNHITSRPYESVSAKPRSSSCSRVSSARPMVIPAYSEAKKPENKFQNYTNVDYPNENCIVGNLHIKSSQDNCSNYIESQIKNLHNKMDNNSLSSKYNYRRSSELQPTSNKYEQYVAEKREQHHNKQLSTPLRPSHRKMSTPGSPMLEKSPVYKKPENLEEAIIELEAIYKSLGLCEQPSPKKELNVTHNDFEKLALAHADDFDDGNSSGGEPDLLRDDVAYRSMQLANLQHKTTEKQLPFGIPIGLVVPASPSDYLHITPLSNSSNFGNTPDIINDDLAVRTLRKDKPGSIEKFSYPSGILLKKNRATRTQSANIYSLIQRDATKPSGGDIFSYLELSKNLDRTASLTNLHDEDCIGKSSLAEVSPTLSLLRILNEQDMQPVRSSIQLPIKSVPQYSSLQQNGGAIYNLPQKLNCKKESEEALRNIPPPVPALRKNLTPEPTIKALHENHQMEAALNQIAKDAEESSVKLIKEIKDLQEEALNTQSKINAEEEKLEQELQEIEAVSEAAKRCGKMLLETLPDAHVDGSMAKPRKLIKEDKLIEAIDQVSEAANAVCEKILKDIVTNESSSNHQEEIKLKKTEADTLSSNETSKASVALEPLIIPRLIKKLDSVRSDTIESIAERCMRQISVLANSTDYDNVQCINSDLVASCNSNENVMAVDAILSALAEGRANEQEQNPQPIQTIKLEEIDKILLECEQKATEISQTSAPETAVPLSELTLKVTLSDKDSTNTHTSSNHQHGNNDNTVSSNVTASSSSDCLAKSSSPSASWQKSSSITSFNPYSSSDYMKSPSSECLAPSIDTIKTFSTTSYEVPSTSVTPNITTHSTFSYSPSPPLNLPLVSQSNTITKKENVHSSGSQYNSSEELAMIFGIDENSKRMKCLQGSKNQKQQQQEHCSGNTTDSAGKDGEHSAITNINTSSCKTLTAEVPANAFQTVTDVSNNRALLVVAQVLPTNNQSNTAVFHNNYVYEKNATKITKAVAIGMLDKIFNFNDNICIACTTACAFHVNTSPDSCKVKKQSKIIFKPKTQFDVYLNIGKEKIFKVLYRNNMEDIYTSLPYSASMLIVTKLENIDFINYLKSLSLLEKNFSNTNTNSFNISVAVFSLYSGTRTKNKSSANDYYKGKKEMCISNGLAAKRKKVDNVDDRVGALQVDSIILSGTSRLSMNLTQTTDVKNSITDTQLQQLLDQRHIIAPQSSNAILGRVNGNEMPTPTAINMYSVFGKSRPCIAATATVNSLTTLKHWMVTYSLGVITPNDLFILFLFVIIVAIVLY